MSTKQKKIAAWVESKLADLTTKWVALQEDLESDSLSLGDIDQLARRSEAITTLANDIKAVGRWHYAGTDRTNQALCSRIADAREQRRIAELRLTKVRKGSANYVRATQELAFARTRLSYLDA